jgi:sugar O-acyltransferase (sialic acid O-acetyltransferase NeuD family)
MIYSGFFKEECMSLQKETKQNREQDSHCARLIVIIGAGGHATSVANVAVSAGYKVKYFVDPKKKGQIFLGTTILGDIAELTDLKNYSFCIAIGDNAIRERIYEEFLKQNLRLNFPCLVHPSAVISCFTEMGAGSIIMPNAVLGPNSKLGIFCILNTSASLDHDCVMSNFSSLAPSAVAGGGVKIGLRTNIAIGAVIKHNVTIGNDSIVGANSYLNKDLPSNNIAYGNPSKIVRARSYGEPYLKK